MGKYLAFKQMDKTLCNWTHSGLVTPGSDMDLGQYWFSSGDGLLSDGTKPLHEPTLIIIAQVYRYSAVHWHVTRYS